MTVDDLPLPLEPPDTVRIAIAQGRLEDKPQSTLVNIVKNSPSSITGFRPKESEARAHRIAVQNCARLNTALVMPEDIR